MENQRNHQGDIVDNQTVNRTNKHLKKRGKQKKKKSIPSSGTLEFQS
jgi:hypothetical protein